MFSSLTDRFHRVFSHLRGVGVLTAQHLVTANAELKEGLLAADVHHDVVTQLITRLEAAVVGQEVARGSTPVGHYLQLVRQELTRTLGGSHQPLPLSGKPPVVILCVGLQGSGKTTTVAKLAGWYKRAGHRPLVIPADLARPAAVEQLQILAQEVGVKVAAPRQGQSVTQVVEDGLAAARAQMCDLVLIDTAGRLHIDAPLMDELRQVHRCARPAQTVLVIDAMAGQAGLVAAKGFHDAVTLTGMILSKTDGDARGGVALSCATVLGVPLYFVGTGERVDALEPFHPDRMAARILDLGDLATLAEQVATVVDPSTVAQRTAALVTGRWTLEDYRAQLHEVGRMGQWERLLGMIPGAHKLTQQIDAQQVARDVKRKLAIMDSMTPRERRDVRVLNGSRRKRIASGSGTTVTEVNRLVKEFESLQLLAKRGNAKQWLQAAAFSR